MNTYTSYTEKITSIEKSLTGNLGLKLSYIKEKSDGIDAYTNYISSKFFPKKEFLSKYDIEERTSIIESAISSYNGLKESIEKDKELKAEQKEFIYKKLKESLRKAEIAKRATLFEAEKNGFDITMDNGTFSITKNEEKIEKIGIKDDLLEKKSTYIKDINTLQDQVYGKKISDTPDERSLVVSICNNQYQKNKEKLNNQEQKVFEDFLNKFHEDIKEYKTPKSRKLPDRGKIKVDTIMQATEHVKNSFYPTIEEREQIKEKGKTSYSVPFESKTREYPDKEEDVFNKLLTTIGHEDAGHMIRGDNQEKNGLIIAGAGYEDIEEGITKLNEGLLKYNLDEYPLIPNNTFIAVFIGENYNFQETFEIIKILKKLQNNEKGDPLKIEEKIKKEAFDTAQRAKCYYPRDEAGSNRKDVIYFRGEKKIIEYLRSLPNNEERANFYKKAMSAKVSFDDIFTLDSLFKEIGTDNSQTNYNKLVDKVFNVKLEKGAGAFSKKPDEQQETNLEKNLIKNDFRFSGMKEYTEKEKKALVEVFDMVNFKKYRGKYVPTHQRNKLKQRDHLKKGNIITLPQELGGKKAKVIQSTLDELQIVFQEHGEYKNGEITTIKKKDIEQIEKIRILNKNKK